MEYTELLKIWHEKKSKIQESNKNFHFNEREIWICYCGLNIGIEQNGTPLHFCRPVVIIKKFNENQCLIASITSKEGSHKYQIQLKKSFLDKNGFIVLSQLKTIDKKRLKKRMGRLSEEEFLTIKQKMASLLDLPAPDGDNVC